MIILIVGTMISLSALGMLAAGGTNNLWRAHVLTAASPLFATGQIVDSSDPLRIFPFGGLILMSAAGCGSRTRVRLFLGGLFRLACLFTPIRF
jgi:hypothetical protein